MALRDKASGRVGSAYQFVEVPDLTKGRLALSGILMTHAVSEEATPAAESSPPPSDGESAIASAARRAFAPGQPLAYGVKVYNARVDPLKGQARLQVQMRVLLDGKEVISGDLRAVETNRQEDQKALFVGGILLLPGQMSSGEYQLVVTVLDTLAPPDRQRAIQSSNFEVEEPPAAALEN